MSLQPLEHPYPRVPTRYSGIRPSSNGWARCWWRRPDPGSDAHTPSDEIACDPGLPRRLPRRICRRLRPSGELVEQLHDRAGPDIAGAEQHIYRATAGGGVGRRSDNGPSIDVDLAIGIGIHLGLDIDIDARGAARRDSGLTGPPAGIALDVGSERPRAAPTVDGEQIAADRSAGSAGTNHGEPWIADARQPEL